MAQADRVALITGGSGYFGSLLLRKCLERGDRCRVLDVNDAADRPANVEFIQGDIRNPEVVHRACQGVSIVHHNVAQVPLAKDRHLFQSVNVEGTRILLEAARAQRVTKLIYTSSSAVFGIPRSNPVTEDTTPEPGEAYGRAKLAAEGLCHTAAREGLDVTIVRPRTILGHGRLGIFQILFEWIRTGFNVPVLGRGDNRYQFVHADDLAELCILAANRSGPSIYHAGTDRFGTMREVLTSLCQAAQTGSRVRAVPMRPAIAAMRVTSLLGLSPLGAYHALMYGRSMFFDISRAQRELNWQPKYSNEEMFLDSYRWYLAHREATLAQSHASHHRSAVRQGVLGLAKWLLV
jgi:nucleoside-diphosphate-sugar epimerase